MQMPYKVLNTLVLPVPHTYSHHTEHFCPCAYRGLPPLSVRPSFQAPTLTSHAAGAPWGPAVVLPSRKFSCPWHWVSTGYPTGPDASPITVPNTSHHHHPSVSPGVPFRMGLCLCVFAALSPVPDTGLSHSQCSVNVHGMK